jgi:hypothetical protein
MSINTTVAGPPLHHDKTIRDVRRLGHVSHRQSARQMDGARYDFNNVSTAAAFYVFGPKT